MQIRAPHATGGRDLRQAFMSELHLHHLGSTSHVLLSHRIIQWDQTPSKKSKTSKFSSVDWMKLGEQPRPFKTLKGLNERLIIIYFSSLHKSSWNGERKEA